MEQSINKKLYDFLKQTETIKHSVLDQSFKESQQTQASLAKILVERDVISDDSLGKIVADLYQLPYIQLSQVSISPDLLKTVPERLAKKHKVIVFKRDTKGIHIATCQPDNQIFYSMIHIKTGETVVLHYATESEVAAALSLYTKEITVTFEELISSQVKNAEGKPTEEAPIIKIVDMLIQYAYQHNASDIHIEPLDDRTLVRFRIDGELHDIIQLPKELNSQLVTRIKVMANLRTDEHLEPQDGKVFFITDSRSTVSEELDLRVSIVPVTKGEKVVMRLLSERSRQFSLQDLGLSGQDLEKVESALSLSHGMILSTGPTGSGKTTTLYSILKLINKRSLNIMTIEDPVEYEMESVNQIQVNVKTGLTFAKGLRSIVRQDPNVILVGEIRDEETADIAVNSAMTGHLVLSTLHTNDAATTFPRLIDMKIEPYLISSSVKVVIGQRLVRKICSKCRVSEVLDVSKLDSQIKTYLGTKATLQTYRGKGCSICHNTGYAGRIGIFEVVVINDEIATAITGNASAPDLRKLAVKNGMKTMAQDGIEKVKQGITTIEEVLRATKE